MNQKRVQELIRELLVEIGEDPNREGLLRTPERVAKFVMRASEEPAQERTSLPTAIWRLTPSRGARYPASSSSF